MADGLITLRSAHDFQTTLDRLLKVLRPYGILEMVRTGVVAMRRGTKVQQEAAAAAAAGAPSNGTATVTSDDNVSYSV